MDTHTDATRRKPTALFRATKKAAGDAGKAVQDLAAAFCSEQRTPRGARRKAAGKRKGKGDGGSGVGGQDRDIETHDHSDSSRAGGKEEEDDALGMEEIKGDVNCTDADPSDDDSLTLCSQGSVLLGDGDGEQALVQVGGGYSSAGSSPSCSPTKNVYGVSRLATGHRSYSSSSRSSRSGSPTKRVQAPEPAPRGAPELTDVFEPCAKPPTSPNPEYEDELVCVLPLSFAQMEEAELIEK